MRPLNEIVLPQTCVTRAATMADIADVVDLINECTQAATGEQDATIADKTNAWETPSLNITADTHLVFAENGSLIGHLEFWDILEPHIQVSIHIHVHPNYAVQTIGAYLLQWADRRTNAMPVAESTDVQLVLLSGADGRDQSKQHLLLTNGYSATRTFWRMVLEMAVAPPEPVWPQGVVIRPHVVGQDDQVVHGIIEAAFADHWHHVPIGYDQWRHWNIEDEEFDPSLWFLACAGDKVVGAIMAWPTFSGDDKTGWVSDLGVHPKWRKQGIGKALLLHVCHTFYRRNIRNMVLIVDSDSPTNAPHLYTQIGMQPMHKRIVFEKDVK